MSYSNGNESAPHVERMSDLGSGQTNNLTELECIVRVISRI